MEIMIHKQRKIRVLHVIPRLTTGGRERSVINVLKNIDRSKFEVAIVSLFPYSESAFEREAELAGLQMFYLSKNKGWEFEVLAELHRVFRSFKPDVVHSHLYIMHYVLPVCIWCNIKIRIHTFGNPVRIKTPHIWQKILHLSAFHVFRFHSVSLSHYLADDIKLFYLLRRSYVIYNGVDVGNFVKHPEKRKEWRDKHGISAQARVIVKVARLHSQKNHTLLLNAFKEVAEHDMRSLLLLVGEGALREKLEHTISALGLYGRVHLLGNRQDIADILNASDVVVSASDWEGLPVNLIEAMAAGKPVVATAVGGVPELIIHGHNGFLVPPGDRELLAKAMRVLCANEDMAYWMGDQGHLIVQEKFDVREMACRYGLLYSSLFEQV
jgi:glycosyltransferase involved in cell wall biosynthesis